MVVQERFKKMIRFKRVTRAHFSDPGRDERLVYLLTMNGDCFSGKCYGKYTMTMDPLGR